MGDGEAGALREIRRRLLLVGAVALCAVLAGGLYVANRSHAPAAGAAPAAVARGLSCPAAGHCLVVDDQGNVLRLDHDHWSARRSLSRDGLGAISCPTRSFCVTVGVNGSAAHFDGRSWSRLQRIDVGASNHVDAHGTSGLSAVSCPTARFCMAGDALGRTLTYDGHGWSEPTPIEPTRLAEKDQFFGNAGITGISCPTPGFCAAVTDYGRAMTFNGATWSAPVRLDPAPARARALALALPALTAVSCSSADHCVAVDSSGNAFTYGARSWSPPTPVDLQSSSHGAHDGLRAVSCPSTTFCAAGDGSGFVLTLQGSRWSAPVQIAQGIGIGAISCPAAGSCVALDDIGDALTSEGSSWSKLRALGT